MLFTTHVVVVLNGSRHPELLFARFRRVERQVICPRGRSERTVQDTAEDLLWVEVLQTTQQLWEEVLPTTQDIVASGGTADNTGNCCGWRYCRQHSSCGWRYCRKHKTRSTRQPDDSHTLTRTFPSLHSTTESAWCRPRDDHQTPRSHGLIQIQFARYQILLTTPTTKPWCLPLIRINNLGSGVGHGSGDGHGSGRETQKFLSAPAPKRSLTCHAS